MIVLLFLASVALGDEKKPLTFRLTLMGESEDTAATKAGFHTSYFRTTHLGFNEYEASDGEKVVIHNGNFKNAVEAKRYFDWMLKKWSAQVVRQGDKADQNGRTVGLRAAYLMKGSSKEENWVVMWTDEENFHLIEAPTLECALALEKLCGPPLGSPEYCASIELLRPNLVLTVSTTVQGRVTDQTSAPFKNSPVELRRFISESKQERVKKLSTDADGTFDLGIVKRGDYRLLLSPHRGFKQPEKMECSSRTCTLDVVLIVNPTEQLASACPIR